MHRYVRRLPKSFRQALKAIPGVKEAGDRLFSTPKGDPSPPGSLRPVVYLPTWLEWDYMRQRPQYLLEALAGAGHQIWFVDPRQSENKEVDGGVRLVKSLAPTPRSDVILYTHFAPTYPLIGRFDRAAVVYDILDDLSIYEVDEKGLPERLTASYSHPSVMERADVVITSSRVLADRHGAERSDLLLVENGVDLALFSKTQSSSGQPPVVGYHGAIAEWFDFDLVSSLAQLHPEWSIVLVGPVDDRVSQRAESLSRLPNVQLSPAQTADRVATTIATWDAGIIPFTVNPMTEGVTPLKMYEYLASGVPVVATPLPACVEHPMVSTASTAWDFAALVEEAVALDDQARLDLTSSASEAAWDRRVQPLLERLDRLGLRYV